MAKKIFEGLGPGTLVPQRGKPDEQPILGAEEGFVLSRVDGRTSLEEICMLVPFDEPVTMVILRRLWEVGVIEVPGVPRTMRPPPSSELPKPPAPPPPKPPSAATPQAGDPGKIEGLSDEQRARIDLFYRELDVRDAFQLLEIERSADDKSVKRAYFKLSKEFHPDRFFGKEMGDYRDKLSRIFQAIKAAFEVLSHKDRRAAYEESSRK